MNTSHTISAILIVWWAFVIAEAGAAIVGAFLLKRIYAQKIAPIATIQDTIPIIAKEAYEN